MNSKELEMLKLNLQERKYPYFEEGELLLLLETHGDVETASYYGCLLKARNDDGIKLPGGLETKSNRDYWLVLARNFIPKKAYKTSMKRVDEK